MFFISNAKAQEAAAQAQPDLLANILPLVIIFVIFYFLLIRPQHKKIKAHEEMVSGLSRGNEVVTNGGIFGKITKVEDSILHVEIAKGVEVRVNRSSVTEVVEKNTKSDKLSKSKTGKK